MNRAIPLRPRKSSTRETPITKSIIRDLKERPRVFVHKNHGGRFGNSGLPDLLISFVPIQSPGGLAIVVGMEVKRPGKVPTPLQQKTLENMKRCGMFATVATSRYEAIQYLKGLGLPEKQEKKE